MDPGAPPTGSTATADNIFLLSILNRTVLLKEKKG